MSKKSTAKKKSDDKMGAKRDYKNLFYRKLTETHLFYEVGRIIASELEPSDLVEKIVSSIRKAITFEGASVYVVKKDMTGLDPLSVHAPSAQDKTFGAVYFDVGAPGEIAASGEPLFLEDATLFEGFIHHPDEEIKTGSYIGVPLKNENRIVGVMGFSHSRKAAFRVEDFDLLRTLSHLISAGIEKAELFKKTLELSRVDELTGLLNYRVLLEKLEEEIHRQARTAREFSFIMIDIDDFKRINDRYGHLEGSRLIAQMGPLLKSACRTASTDICFRYGGEEFSILLAETDLQEALGVAERVRKTVEEYPFSVKVIHPFEQVTVSLGVSIVSRGGKTVPEIMNEADVALYRSKATGKNRVTPYSETYTMPGPAPEPMSGH
ncbi:MAG TPA: sensor domain-containing diguanylate cyclase [Nitrospirota bacterium]|nr:sensor domain-containing diguanylate cyclase [Nitrospirota bacterium]